MKTKYSQPQGRLNPLNDYLFLKVMGSKGDEVQLLGFLNAVLERTGHPKLKSVEIIENRSLSAEFIGNKSVVLDVRALLQGKSKVNIEVQLQSQPGFDRRMLFYWGVTYTEDQKSGQDYRELPDVTAISIVDFDIPPGGTYHTSYHLWEDAQDLMLSEALEIHSINMRKWRHLDAIDPENIPLHRWLIWLDQGSPPELIAKAVSMDEAIKAADERFAQVCLDPESLRIYRMRQMAEMDRIGQLAYAKEEGREEGIEEGRVEGREEGLEEKALEIAQKLLAYGAAPEFVEQITGLDKETIEKLQMRN